MTRQYPRLKEHSHDKEQSRRRRQLHGHAPFDKKQEKFVHDKKSEIPGMAKDAEKAIEGPEGEELRKAEEIGKSKARH